MLLFTYFFTVFSWLQKKTVASLHKLMFECFVHCLFVDVCFIWTIITDTIWLSHYWLQSTQRQHHMKVMLSCFVNDVWIVLVQYMHPHGLMWSESLKRERTTSKSSSRKCLHHKRCVHKKFNHTLLKYMKKAPSVYTSKTASSSSASVKSDCVAQRKSVEWLGQYKRHMLSVTHRIHWACLPASHQACWTSTPILLGCTVSVSMDIFQLPSIFKHDLLEVSKLFYSTWGGQYSH